MSFSDIGLIQCYLCRFGSFLSFLYTQITIYLCIRLSFTFFLIGITIYHGESMFFFTPQRHFLPNGITNTSLYSFFWTGSSNQRLRYSTLRVIGMLSTLHWANSSFESVRQFIFCFLRTMFSEIGLMLFSSYINSRWHNLIPSSTSSLEK